MDRVPARGAAVGRFMTTFISTVGDSARDEQMVGCTRKRQAVVEEHADRKFAFASVRCVCEV